MFLCFSLLGYYGGYNNENEAYVALYHDWFKEGRDLIEFIKTNMSDTNLWTLSEIRKIEQLQG
jgi:hypothetical protein